MQGVQVVAISDYGKGLLSRSLLAAIIGCAREHAIPVIVDPKEIDFTKYAGATLIKPNLSEAFAAARVSEQAPLELVARNIFDATSIQHLMITRSEAGISLFDTEGGREDFPVHAREVKDVTGAGDTVLAMLTYSIANGLSYSEAIQLCNVAAGIAIEHVGCARVTLADVAKRLLNLHNDNKIFDEDHLHALKRVLRDRQFALLHLSQQAMVAGLSSQIFKTIRSLAATEGRELLVSVDCVLADDPFVEMLASLSEVDFILLNKDESYRSLPAHEVVVLT
jgi:D-glycero-beta-D-manno-heptose-7-phosphate kinase